MPPSDKARPRKSLKPGASPDDAVDPRDEAGTGPGGTGAARPGRGGGRGKGRGGAGRAAGGGQAAGRAAMPDPDDASDPFDLASAGSPEAGGAPDPAPARVINKRQFVARVAAAGGLTAAQVRETVDLTLAQLGRAISAGETLALPPFGKARVSRHKTVKGGEVLVLRLRRKAGEDRLDDEDG